MKYLYLGLSFITLMSCNTSYSSSERAQEFNEKAPQLNQSRQLVSSALNTDSIGENSHLNDQNHKLTVQKSATTAYDMPIELWREISGYLNYPADKLHHVNRSMFVAVTDYPLADIAIKGTEHHLTFKRQSLAQIKGCIVRLKTDENDRFEIHNIQNYVFYSLIENLKALPASSWPHIKDTQIRNVDLSSMEIDAKGAYDLGQALKGTRVDTVDLYNNNISDEGARDFGQGLKGTQVHILNLSDNNIGDEGARDFGQGLKGTQVHTLYLAYNNIGAQGARDLGKGLQGTLVHVIDLSKNNIGAKGARDFGQGLQGTLVHVIDLSKNNIGAEGARNFGQGLQGTRVSKVSLDGNNIGDEGARDFGQALKGTQVREVHLMSNNIGAEGARDLGRAFKRHIGANTKSKQE